MRKSNQMEFPNFAVLARNVVANIEPLEHLEGFTTYVDMFAGIGGFHLAAESFGMKCVFACDIDDEARRAYQHNFGIVPHADIRLIEASKIPQHDLFLAGFPCQPFSIIGNRKGFDDIRGTLFFEIIRILEAKRPRAFLLENVKQLTTHDNGRTIKTIVESLEKLQYHVSWKVLNALDFGLPQKRERVLIAGTQDPFDKFPWPTEKMEMTPLNKILENNPDPKHFVSDRIKRSRNEAHKSDYELSIWHENKGGNVSSYPYSCALRAGASYNYLLVNGERRLTTREMLRLQGFPDSYDIVCNDSQTRKQAGNAVPVPLVAAGIRGILKIVKATQATRHNKSA
jgi:DNA (cytosine-5)-methyltransferase 1